MIDDERSVASTIPLSINLALPVTSSVRVMVSSLTGLLNKGLGIQP
jgi:hypothetical protein